MSSQEPELDALLAALRSDLPTDQERERLRSRVVAAGVGLSAAGAVTSAASVAEASVASASALNAASTAAGTAAGFKLAGVSLAGMSLAGKLGWSVVVIASASALSLAPRWYATGGADDRTDDAKPQASTARERETRVPRRSDVKAATRAVAPAPAFAPAPAPAFAPAFAAAPAFAPAPARSAPVAAVEPASVRPRRSARPAHVAATADRLTAVPAAVVAVPGPRATGSQGVAAAAEAAPASVSLAVAAPAMRSASVSEPAQAAAPLLRRPSALRFESELIERALTALRARHHASARRLLAVHARRFPDGALRPERERLIGALDAHLDGSAVANPEPDHPGGRP